VSHASNLCELCWLTNIKSDSLKSPTNVADEQQNDGAIPGLVSSLPIHGRFAETSSPPRQTTASSPSVAQSALSTQQPVYEARRRRHVRRKASAYAKLNDYGHGQQGHFHHHSMPRQGVVVGGQSTNNASAMSSSQDLDDVPGAMSPVSTGTDDGSATSLRWATSHGQSSVSSAKVSPAMHDTSMVWDSQLAQKDLWPLPVAPPEISPVRIITDDRTHLKGTSSQNDNTAMSADFSGSLGSFNDYRCTKSYRGGDAPTMCRKPFPGDGYNANKSAHCPMLYPPSYQQHGSMSWENFAHDWFRHFDVVSSLLSGQDDSSFAGLSGHLQMSFPWQDHIPSEVWHSPPSPSTHGHWGDGNWQWL
jgi:hypothetical protein